jgi:hypothetical protein
VRVLVVDVRIVRMLVRQRFMPMRMGVRFIAIPGKFVPMPVMLVVLMAMGMLQRLVRMPMLMPFADMQPDAN